MTLNIKKMPDKIYKKGCGSSCVGCWKNRLKHANPQAKKYMKKHNIQAKIEYNNETTSENNHFRE
jgi:hypothetical protein